MGYSFKSGLLPLMVVGSSAGAVAIVGLRIRSLWVTTTVHSSILNHLETRGLLRRGDEGGLGEE